MKSLPPTTQLSTASSPPANLTAKLIMRNLMALTLTVVFLSACGGEPERIWLKTPAWSRGLLVGTTQATDPVPMAALETDQIAFLFTAPADDGQDRLSLAAFNDSGSQAWVRDYEWSFARIEAPRLVLSQNRLHLLWIVDEALYGAVVDANGGELIEGPQILTGEDRVHSFDIAVGPDGVPVIWYAGPRRSPGLMEIVLAPVNEPPRLIDPLGVRPDIEFDDQDRLIGVWTHYPLGFGEIEFLYSVNEGGRFAQGRSMVVANPGVAPTAVMQGPVFSLAGGRAYVFWTIIHRTGLSAGTAQSTFVHFPVDDPRDSSAHLTLLIPTAYDLPYQEVEADYPGLNQRVLLPAQGIGRTSFITDLYDAETGGEDLFLVFSARANYLLRKQELQIGSLLIEKGAPTSYELISFSPAASMRPSVIQDQKGVLHLAWVEKGAGRGFKVYYTSTEPAMKQALARLTLEDVTRLVADSAFGIATGALLAPIAIGIWGIGPLVLLAVTSLIRREDEGLLGPGTLVSMAAAIALFWSMKPILISGIGSYLPFSAWIPVIPAWLEAPLIYGVPVLIGVLGATIAWYFTYRVERRSPMIFFIIYAAVDGFLTTGLYGALFYGAT